MSTLIPYIIAVCFACFFHVAIIWLCIFCPICFQEPAHEVCQNERSLLPKGCPEKHHQSVPKWAVRRHAPCQQLDTRCKGQPWLVKVLVLPTEAYCWDWTRHGSYSDSPQCVHCSLNFVAPVNNCWCTSRIKCNMEQSKLAWAKYLVWAVHTCRQGERVVVRLGKTW